MLLCFMNRKLLNKSNYDASILIKDDLKISVCLDIDYRLIKFKYFLIYLSFYLNSLSMTFIILYVLIISIIIFINILLKLTYIKKRGLFIKKNMKKIILMDRKI